MALAMEPPIRPSPINPKVLNAMVFLPKIKLESLYRFKGMQSMIFLHEKSDGALEKILLPSFSGF